MEFKELYERAKSVAKPRRLAEYTEVGVVGAAICTDKGNVYVGCNIDAPCGMGFCAEHSAIAAMITAGECRIEKVVAVNSDGKIYPPCGRCREFMYRICDENINAHVLIDNEKAVPLSELLPNCWGK